LSITSHVTFILIFLYTELASPGKPWKSKYSKVVPENKTSQRKL